MIHQALFGVVWVSLVWVGFGVEEYELRVTAEYRVQTTY